MARAKSSPQVYVATESGSADVDGDTITFVKGQTRIRAGHAILSQLPNFFEPADEHLNYEVEDAMAGPGVKRDAIIVGDAPEPEQAPEPR
jgi:hypothetical protein